MPLVLPGARRISGEVQLPEIRAGVQNMWEPGNLVPRHFL